MKLIGGRCRIWLLAILVSLVVVRGAEFDLVSATFAQGAPMQPIEVSVRPLPRFGIASLQTRFGALEYVGGFSMSGSERIFGQLSGLRFLSPGSDFIGVADHGYWFFGRIERDADMVPVGIGDFRMQAMMDAEGDVIAEKHFVDAEGLDVHEGIATVAFEREARVSEYALNLEGMSGPLRDLDFLIPRRELRYNAGIETVARAPADGVLGGARIVVAERSIDDDGNIFAAVLEGPRKGIFTVARTDEFDVTDGVFLPGGDLLLLERRFRPLTGVAMRLRRIAGTSIVPGALVDGETLMEANMAYHIDNMEAVDVWRREDGALVVSLMSDDNQSLLQRNLYLEFVLVDEPD